MPRDGQPVTGLPSSTRYEPRGPVGAGAMGIVERVWDRELQLDVARKRLRVGETTPEQQYQLKQEFRALRDIVHPNLARLYDLDVSEAYCFFTMELIEGVDFLAFTREGAPPRSPAPVRDLDRLRRATVQLVHGLAMLHGHGKVHRDVKPRNVLVDRHGRVVLLDFGLVIEAAPHAGEAPRHDLAGTLDYMAPELLWGRRASPAADWYGVGIMLFEALTGQLPFAGPPVALVQAKQRGPSVGPGALVPSVPAALDAVVVRLLDPDPAGRAGADDLLGALGATRAARPEAAGVDGRRRGAPFVGRREELAQLEATLAAVRAGDPAVVHVRGPSGIGKSDLVRRFAELAHDDALVLMGRCHLRETVPYQALDALVDELSRRLLQEPADAVRDLAPRHVAALVQLFPVLGRVPAFAAAPSAGLALEPQERRRQGVQALRDLLARLAERRPVVLWIDDAQWGDRDSALLVRELLRPPEAPRLLLLLSYPHGDTGGAPLVAEASAEQRVTQRQLDLSPLPRTETRALATALLRTAAAPDAADVDAIVRESAGSPFFVGELVRFVGAHGREDAPRAVAPPTVAEVVHARLDALPAASRDLLELVAVAGRPIGATFALGLTGAPGGGSQLVRDLESECLLQRTHGAGGAEGVEVYHDRIRETLVTSMGAARRRAHHRRLADAFAAQPRPDPQTLMTHYLGAGEEALAAEHAVRAAEEAARALAFDQAAELFGLAHRLRGERDADWELLARRAEALAGAGRGAEAGEVYEAASAALGRAAPARGTDLALRRRAGEQYLAGGRLHRGVDVLTAVLADLGVPVPSSAAAARRSALARRLLLLVRGLGHRLREPAAIDPEAVLRLDALWATAKGTLMLDFVLSDAMAARHLTEALRAGHPSHLHWALCMEAGVEANVGGRWLTRRSRRTHALAQALARRTGQPYDEGWVYGSGSVLAYYAERWTETLELAARGIEIFTTRCTGATWEATTLETFRLAALTHLGRVRALRARLPELLDDARSRGDLFALAVVRTGHTVLASLAADDPDGALRDAESMLLSFTTDHFTSQHFHHLVATVQAHLYAGEPWAAWERVVAAWPGVRQAGFLLLDCLGGQLRYLRALAALAAADAPPRGPAGWSAARLERAARREAWHLARSRVPSGPARAAAIRAALAARGGDRAQRRRFLVTARDGFARVQMALHRDATRLQLAALDERADEWLAAEASLRDESVRNPVALMRTLVPAPLPSGRGPRDVARAGREAATPAPA